MILRDEGIEEIVRFEKKMSEESDQVSSLFIVEFPTAASVGKSRISSFAMSKKRYCSQQSLPFICNAPELLLFATVASVHLQRSRTVAV